MLSYILIRILTFPFAYLPYSSLHTLGRFFGLLAYHLVPKWRKRALSNIALALPKEDPVRLAKACFQSLLITVLEYPKLAHEKKIERIAYCDNPEPALEILKEGKGLIFFCGHQANWELLFLEGTSRMPGVAIGRPVKNSHLYAWIKRMREKFGGKIISPKEAVKEGLRALRKGKFLGIVGDQGMPDSGFSCPFLGRLAWTSPLPALLSTRSGAPVIVASVVREKNRYKIHYSDPLFPDIDAPKEQEIDRLMRAILSLFEKSVREHPDQWLWIHNRWKQQTLDRLKKPYRQDALALFLPDDKTLVQEISAFRKLYPQEFIACFVPRHLLSHCELTEAEIHPYDHINELLRKDYRFKLLFNFTEERQIDAHYKKLSALTIVHLNDLAPGATLHEKLVKTLCPTIVTT